MMIIIRIIILYFIQISHTDDFPSTATYLSPTNKNNQVNNNIDIITEIDAQLEKEY